MVAIFACFNMIKILVFTLYLDECLLIMFLKRPYFCWDLKVLGSFSMPAWWRWDQEPPAKVPLGLLGLHQGHTPGSFWKKALWEEVWERYQSWGTSWASQCAGRAAGASPGTQCTDWRLLGASAACSCPGTLPAAPPARLHACSSHFKWDIQNSPRLSAPLPQRAGACMQI